MYKLIRNGDRAGVQLAVQREPALLDAPVTRNKHTPLMFALLKGSGGQPAIAQWLIARGAKRNLQDNLGWTALMFACRHNQRDTARLLIECGVELDLQNKKGWTALMFACCYAQPDTARLLIKRGAKLDLQNDEGGTAFMIACSRQPSTPNLLRCVRLCFAAGANVELRKKNGRDALALAKVAERADAVALLEFATALEATRRQQQLRQEQQQQQQQQQQQHTQQEQGQEQSSPQSVVTTLLQSQDELQTNTLRELVLELLDQGVQTMNEARRLGFSRLAQLGICSAQDRQLFVKAFGENENHSKLEALAATVAFARGLRDDGKPILHKMLRSALTRHLKPSSTLEALLNVDTDQADIRDRAALFSKIQSAVETTSTKANMRNAFRKKLVDSVRKALANGMQDHLANFENFYDMQHIVDSYRTLWKDILCEPVSCETCSFPITFEKVQRATKAALKALTEWETEYDTSAARERTLASICALDASTTDMGMRHTFYMTLMHPERMSELRGLKAPDTDRAESLVKDLRDARKKRKRIARELEDAEEDANDGDDDARAEIPKLERELAKIGSVYKLDSRLRKERAHVLRHAEMHYPELLGDQEWLKRIGISDGVPLELSKAGLWLSHVKQESFATLDELASKPGKTVQKVRASDGRTLVLKTFHLANDTWSGRFYRQVVALAEMRSAYVVRIEGAFMQDAQHGCVIMPYYPGGDLFAWIRDNAHADVATRKRIAIGLLSGLHDLHSRNLVHCDIKPENIFLARGLSPVLGDFDGVQTHDVTMTQPLQATVKYLAPELRNENIDKVEPAVDMYSVGMVLKELFQNCPMPQALQNLTTMLTARNPRERPSALVALRHQAFQVEPVPVGACAICLDSFPIAEVVACDEAHFTCKTCLQQAIQAAAEPGGHVQILANGSMKCITPDCDLHISGRTIAAAVPEKDYEVLQKIVRKHAERELAREHERDVQRRVDEVLRDHGLDPETQNHLRKIQNEILTMSCPRCSAAFAVFSGCCALKCGNDCSCYFCAWCLKDAGNSSQGCHQHIANCPSKRSADPYFADFGTVQEAWAQIRTQRLRHYMTERIQNDDIRKKVLEKLQHLLTSDIIGAPFRL
ncbi:Protein kinase, putative [Hondaea fermentalgiana]|uniref:Protein kinase, putative n=1 Tax=Hondaea fermentalgiana TaxID=2315210 RepID=A0A2R5GNM7_9STRA|nr:Protein kinase, putative [Hondaea fermentalgiana]|eukprot:GBG29474.1 Protein kinase, putative [Hondaea fermentalgiana]